MRKRSSTVQLTRGESSFVRGDGIMSRMGGAKLGRPRDERADRAILDATTQLLIEGGFGRLSVDAVAARAGVGKATIYRRWSSKTDLIRATLARFKDAAQSVDTGGLRTDLRDFLRLSVAEFVDSPAAQVMPLLAAESQFDPALRELLHAYAKGRRDVIGEILDRADARGELRDDLDFEVVIDMLIAPIFVRKLITGAPITAEATDKAVDIVLAAISAP